MIKKSVHLQDFPDVSVLPSDKDLVRHMDKVRDICNAALSIRSAKNIRVRQPLASMKVIGKDSREIEKFIDIIKDEVNIKTVNFEPELEKHAEFKLKINFPVLGKRLQQEMKSEKMKQVIPASKKGEWEQADGGKIKICGEILEHSEAELLLEPKPEYQDSAKAISTQDALVILDLNITEELLQEGIARDIVRLIQQARKDANLDVSDRINLVMQVPDQVAAAVNVTQGYIKEQTLAASLMLGEVNGLKHTSNTTLDGKAVTIGFSVAV